jgi:hypothetical protein
MAKTITLSNRQWEKLKSQIIEDYGRTTVLISWRLREQLGFTLRQHKDATETDWAKQYTMRLDFWDDMLHTIFLLKYSDYLL